MAMIDSRDYFVVTDRMRTLLNRPGLLKADEGGQLLRLLYKRSEYLYTTHIVDATVLNDSTT